MSGRVHQYWTTNFYCTLPPIYFLKETNVHQKTKKL